MEACPVRIDIPRMLIELRRDVSQAKIAPWSERVAFKLLAQILTRPRLYRFAATAARILQIPFAREGTIGRLPLSDWTRSRDLPAVAARTFQERWTAERDGAP
jgi:L-lactate dehydrogenase complex protein LldF